MDIPLRGSTWYRCEAKYHNGWPIPGVVEFGAAVAAAFGMVLGFVGLWTTRDMGPMISYPFALAMASSFVSAMWHWTYRPEWSYLDEIANALATSAAAVTFLTETFFRLRRESSRKAIPIISAVATLGLCAYMIFLLNRATSAPGGIVSSAMSNLSSILVSLSMVVEWLMRREYKPPPGSKWLVLAVFMASVVSCVLWVVEMFACPRSIMVSYAFPGALWELFKAYEIYSMMVLTVAIRMFNYKYTVEYRWRPRCVPLIPMVKWGSPADAERDAVLGELPPSAPAVRAIIVGEQVAAEPIARAGVLAEGSRYFGHGP